MAVRQRLLRSAPGLTFLLANLFFALTLGGYDPADEPGVGVEPPNRSPQLSNPCGPVGATLAHGCFTVLGWSSWLVLIGLLVANLLVLRGRKPSNLRGPLVGFALLLAMTSGLLQWLAPGLQPSPPVGSGGYLGALVATFLVAHFGQGGMFLIMLASAFFGILLSHDLLLTWPAQVLIELVTHRGRFSGDLAVSAHPGGNEPTAMSPQAWADHEPPREGLPRPVGARARATELLPAVQTDAAIATNAPLSLPRRQGSLTDPGEASLPNPSVYELPPRDLLEPPAPFPIQEHEAKVHARALLLERTLLDFGYQVRVVQIDTGPVITQFEIELEAGLRVSRIMSLADDLAIALAVPSVRIVAPIPGKTTVGIEVPNDLRGMVRLGEVIAGVEESSRKCRIPLFLGKDVKGAPLVFDLVDMPHLLIAGRTGTGKSVCLNAMILSILMTRTADEVRLILIDPKMVELSQFRRIPHLMHPVVTDMKKAESILAWACDKMDERYGFLARAGVRNISSYNRLGAQEIYERLRPEDEEERQRIPTYMPYIVIIADEMADLMMTAAKEVEQHIVRLAQKARAVGMHLIVATQKPTVDVVTGLIKGNLPARIAFQVSSRGDSRVVLDEIGADRLLGNGDMLFLIPGTSHIIRAQGTYVSDLEVNRVCQFLERYKVEFSKELMQLQVGGGPAGKERGAALKERDELYEPAIEIVVREGRGSCSLLQRALGIGYGRAARLIDFMAEDGIVGEYKSGSAREVLYTWEEWEALKGGNAVAEGVREV